ncbi:229_t:CDS:2, partial [Cetraspora pellucida]
DYARLLSRAKYGLTPSEWTLDGRPMKLRRKIKLKVMNRLKLITAITILMFCILGLITLSQRTNIVKPIESKEFTKPLTTLATPSITTTVSPSPIAIVDKWKIWPPDLRYAICKPKIYIYKIPSSIQINESKKLRCRFSKNNVEIILFEQLSKINSTINNLYVTENPKEADLFYIPFFGSCYLFNCWINNNWNKTENCQVDLIYLEPLMNYIIQKFPYWNKTNGKDHFIIHPMNNIDDYYEKKEIFHNSIYLTTNGNLDYPKFRKYRNIVIPSTTPILNIFNLNPSDYIGRSNRDIKGVFRGCANGDVKDNYSDGIRYILFNGLKGLPGWDIEEETSSIDDYARLLSRAKYGLTPSEWTLDTIPIWEYFAFGVVPVVIADEIIDPFEDDMDWDSMIVRVRRNEAYRINEILDAIPEDEYLKKRERVSLIGKNMLKVIFPKNQASMLNSWRYGWRMRLVGRRSLKNMSHEKQQSLFINS